MSKKELLFSVTKTSLKKIPHEYLQLHEMFLTKTDNSLFLPYKEKKFKKNHQFKPLSINKSNTYNNYIPPATVSLPLSVMLGRDCHFQKFSGFVWEYLHTVFTWTRTLQLKHSYISAPHMSDILVEICTLRCEFTTNSCRIIYQITVSKNVSNVEKLQIYQNNQ